MIQKPKGTRDILPDNIYKWQYVENTIKEILENAGMKEIRVPVFEYTELFSRGVRRDNRCSSKRNVYFFR